MIDHMRLRAIAEAATAGQWAWWTSNSYLRLSSDKGKDGDILHAEALRDGWCTVAISDQNREHIAACSPAVILALLDELDALRASAARKPVKQGDYPADFEGAWAAYPPRKNSNKITAFKAWKARITAGVRPDDMIAGVKRYAAYIKAEGTEECFIKQPSTFFGPDYHFDLPWVSSRAQATGRKGQMHGSIGSQDFAAGVGSDGSF